jgi:CRISPR-associated protein Csx3
MEHFPAVIIGGPPDSGKSVLTANLTQALRERGVAHYVLRACPDGEGDWSHLADQEQVRTLVVPRQWTPSFVEHVCRDLERRHLPLIVDVGGRPQPWQEAIFGHCTHAILLTKDEDSHHAWLDRVTRHGLILLADLRSELEGESVLADRRPVLRGTIAGLERGVRLESTLFEALVERMTGIFAYDAEKLRQVHLDAAPVETSIDLDRLARTLHIPHRKERAVWEPRHLPQVLDYLPQAISLGAYGRGPNWLYAALALLAAPSTFVQFDPRLGWVEARSLRLAAPEPSALLQFQIHERLERERRHPYTHLEGLLPTAYVDYSQIDSLVTPPIRTGTGVVLSGQLPHWLTTSLALTYRTAPWIAVYQPQLEGAAVVYSADQTQPVGNLLSLH